MGTGVQEVRPSVLCLEVKNGLKKPPTGEPRARGAYSRVHFSQQRDHGRAELCFKLCISTGEWALSACSHYWKRETITLIEVGGKKRAEAQAEIGAEEAIFIQISISKSASLTIELQTLTDGAASKTAAKNKKSSTTVI